MLMIGFTLMNHQITKCTGSGVAIYMHIYIYTHLHTLHTQSISRIHATYMKQSKISEVLKYSVSCRLSLSEGASSKCNHTIKEVTAVCELCISTPEDRGLLSCAQKKLLSAVLMQG